MDRDSRVRGQHIDPWEGYPMPFGKFTKIQGPLERHIEQLWDEVKKLRKELNAMKRISEE